MSYGTWLSPINSSAIVENTLTPLEIQIDEKGNVYWLELRPVENGRYVIRSNRTKEDLIPKTFNCRTRVHEYGGGAYIVKNDIIYFTNFVDQRIYSLDLNGNNLPIPLTNETENSTLRYADLTIDLFRNQLICVHENHLNETNVQNTIIGISLNDSSSLITFDEGYDFYSSPRLSPDGKYLIWICWNHPNMPWDQTELWIGEFNNEKNSLLINKKKLFGKTDESILQPKWSPDGKFIYFISDQNGWWNIYRTTIDGQTVEHIYNMEAEFGGPPWQFASSYYDFDSNGNIITSYWQNGIAKLSRIDVQTNKLSPLTATEIYTDIRYVRAYNNNVYFIGSSSIKPAEVVEYNFETDKKQIFCCATNLTIDQRYLSVPEMITFKTGNDIAYGIYYPPKNDDYPISTNTTELPPLLVRTHGGPTSATTSAFNLRIQYWTSRGYALLDVNYRGSTGYGRKFRDSLKDNWGIYDVQDCIAGAEYLVQQNKVDKNRLTIDGGSAGGYTTLCALTMHNYFSAGASHYGVTDLELLARDTHKFEARYLDRLIGEYPAKKQIYFDRSPINHVKNLSKPVIFFQGSEDKIVLPSQAELMVNALREKHLPVAYVLFEGEQHGFRKAENIRKSLDGQFYFFSKIFHFQMADHVEPIPIENLPNN
jgi:dipeptidyl aminopeptidase/acylaminoacyl peptidase